MDQEVLDALNRLDAEASELEARAADEQNPGMKAEYLRQAEHVTQRGRQIAAAARLPTGAEKIRTLMQGLTLSGADEIEAGVRAPFSDRTYTDIRNDIRGQNAAFAQQFPQDAMGLQVAGSLPWMAVAPGAAWASRAAGAPSMIGRTAAIGAGEGGAMGYLGSESETLPGQAIDTAKGAGIGGGIGASIPAAAAYGPALWRGLKNTFTGSPSRLADEALGDVFTDLGFTPQRVRSELDALGPEAVLADVSPEAGALLGRTRQKGGTAGQLIDETIGARQAGGRSRLEQNVRDITATDKDLNAEVVALKEQRRALDEVAYPRALSQDVEVTEELLEVLENPAISSQAKHILALNRVGDLEPGDYLPVGVLNDIKKTVDRSISSQLVDQTGQVVTEASVPATQYQRRSQESLLRLVDEQVPDYGTARAQHAAISRELDPIERGRKYYSATDSQRRFEIRNAYEAMDPAQQQRFREGVVMSITDDIRRSGGAGGTGMPFSRLGDEGIRGERFMGATGSDPASMSALEGAVDAERRFGETFRLTDPNTGSKTATLLGAGEAADEATGLLATTARAAAGDLTELLNRIRSVKGMSRPVADEIAKRLTNNNITDEYLMSLAQRGDVPLDALEALTRHLRLITGGMPAAVTVGTELAE
jgi:hypothetical protein